jgi:hypothetical protein
VKFYAQNVNPNERWPWSQWVYTGENKTIRVGKADGSNVGRPAAAITSRSSGQPARRAD